MADCPKHDKIIEELAEIKQRITANEKNIDNGWRVIRRTEERVDSLETIAAETKEKTNSIFRMLKDLTKSIQGIDEKMDEFIKDVRSEIKETNAKLNQLEKETAVSKVNIDWNWKTILAFGTVITFLVGMLGNIIGGAF